MIKPAPAPSHRAEPQNNAGKARRASRQATVALLGLAFASAQALAQSTAPPTAPPTTSPPTEQPPLVIIPERPNDPAPSPTAVDTPSANAARSAATLNALSESRPLTLKESASLGRRPSSASVLTEVGTGATVGEGSRVLRVPGACTPKTNSLDCVADAGPSAQGANVSSKVRNSVIGEVGAGRGATEGGGNLKREGPCIPQPGQLSCQ